ncbi:hypothetical protein ACJ72_00285 [Emergomyces africanus]|uniref:Uncharacterized protein n=1 Tax=Emergomyces africanus TaxID=1955775 RepID=A0A1B7P8K0_9EURO|nr:hypothetical protein ACJ72_00285 [Emergomyces africanus]
MPFTHHHHHQFTFELTGSDKSQITAYVDENQTNPTTVINYAALGDSYASGIDAGKELHHTCWRFKDSYPMQLIRTGMLGPNHAFQFLACSGAVMGMPGTSFSKKKSISKQIKALRPTDVVTLSIGGNDAGFFDILNACVYRFYGLRSGNCKEQLQKSTKIISSDQFADAYHNTLTDILAKGTGPHFRLLALGYSPFFDETFTDDCNSKSFGYWKMWQPKLTVKLRRQLNDVSLHLNSRILEIIEARVDDRIVWVDWASKFKGHLFCPPGKGRASVGDDTWFFDVDFRSANSTSEDIDVDTCELQKSPDWGGWGDWGHRAACGIAIVQKQYSEYPHLLYRASDDDEDDDNFSANQYTNQPGLARVFHPKPQGYMAIARAIESHWAGMPSQSGVSGDST